MYFKLSLTEINYCQVEDRSFKVRRIVAQYLQLFNTNCLQLQFLNSYVWKKSK